MDIKKACDILHCTNNPLSLKCFTEQYRHFKLSSTTPLKEYFDFINERTLEWLQSHPQSIKSKETFRKYRTPINFLLENPDVQDALGRDYCLMVQKNMKNNCQKHIEEVVESRKQNINLSVVDVRVEQEPTSDFELEHTDEDSESDDGLDISLLEPIDSKHPNQDIDYKTLYEQLKHNLVVEQLRKDNEQLKKENERLWEVVKLFASK